MTPSMVRLIANAHLKVGNDTTAKDLCDVADTLEKLYAERDAADKLRAENERLRTAVERLRVTLSDVQTYAGAALAYPVPSESEGEDRG